MHFDLSDPSNDGFGFPLFADVVIDPRDGNVLIQVIENPIINRVIFEGNRSLKTDKINDEISAEPRALFTRAQVQEDTQLTLLRDTQQAFYK